MCINICILPASVLSADFVSGIQRPVRGKQAVIRRAIQLIKGVIDFPFVKRHAHGLSAGVTEQAYHIPRGTDSGHETLYLPERVLPACVHVGGEIRAEGRRGRKGRRSGGERLLALGHVQLREVGHSFGKAGLRKLAILRKAEVVVEAAPRFRVQPAALFSGQGFNLRSDYGLQRALLVRGEGSIGGRQLVGIFDRFGLGAFFLRQLVQHIQNPMAELLGYRSAGEHRQKVAAAKGEDAATACAHISGNLILRFCDDFNELRHIRRELVGVPLVDLGNLIFTGEAKSAGKFCGSNPKAVLVGDGGKGDFVETKSLGHGKPRKFLIAPPMRKKRARKSKPLANGRGITATLFLTQYVREYTTLYGREKAIDKRNGGCRKEILKLRALTTPQNVENVKQLLKRRGNSQIGVRSICGNRSTTHIGFKFGLKSLPHALTRALDHFIESRSAREKDLRI